MYWVYTLPTLSNLSFLPCSFVVLVSLELLLIGGGGDQKGNPIVSFYSPFGLWSGGQFYWLISISFPQHSTAHSAQSSK